MGRVLQWTPDWLLQKLNLLDIFSCEASSGVPDHGVPRLPAGTVAKQLAALQGEATILQPETPKQVPPLLRGVQLLSV